MFGIGSNGLDGSLNSLKNTVEGLAKKGEIREQKIKGKLEVFAWDVQRIKNEINIKTQQLVDAEINEDVNGQDQINKVLDRLRKQLDDTESKIAAYQRALEAPALSEDEVKKVKTACMKARQERQKKVADLDEQMQARHKQIQALTEEINRLNEEKFTLQQPKEAFVAKPVMGYIHTEFKDEKYKTQLGDYQFSFNDWLIR